MPTIKEIRTREGLTQDDLAAAAGVSRRRVIELEHGYRPSRGDSLARVAAALGVSVEEIGAAQGGGS